MRYYKEAAKVFALDEGDGLPGRLGRPYRDSMGNWTIGRGHLIGSSLYNLKLSPRIIEELFKEDLERAESEAMDIVGIMFFNSLAPARQIALVSMLFTLGPSKFARFEQTIKAIKNEDWEGAAKGVLGSKWARDVDPKQRLNEGRDDRIAYMFQHGEFHPDYKI